MDNKYYWSEKHGRHLYKELVRELSKNDNNLYDLEFTEDDFDVIDCVMTTTKLDGDTVKSDVEIKVRTVRKPYTWEQIRDTILEDKKYRNLMDYSDHKHKLYVVFYPQYDKALIYKMDKYRELPRPFVRKCNLSTCANNVVQVDKLVYMLPIHTLPKKYLSVIDFDCEKAIETYDVD